jgi:hypothetical protein
MDTQSKLTLTGLLCSLRQRLLDAREQKDQTLLGELMITFSILREASYNSKDTSVITILVALEDCARDFLGGMGFKRDMPTVEVIRAATSPSEAQ